MKKIGFIVSVILNVVLLITGVVLVKHNREYKAFIREEMAERNGDGVSDADQIKAYILERERLKLPLQIQELERVYDITIEDFVWTEADGGYLVTEWDYDEKVEMSLSERANNGYMDKFVRTQKKVYVEVKHIMTNPLTGDLMWFSGWTSAMFNLKK